MEIYPHLLAIEWVVFRSWKFQCTLSHSIEAKGGVYLTSEAYIGSSVPSALREIHSLIFFYSLQLSDLRCHLQCSLTKTVICTRDSILPQLTAVGEIMIENILATLLVVPI